MLKTLADVGYKKVSSRGGTVFKAAKSTTHCKQLLKPLISQRFPHKSSQNDSMESAHSNNYKTSSLYHYGSTRYVNTSREVLKSLEVIPDSLPHYKPETLSDKFAMNVCKFLRWATDIYFKDDLLTRAMMIETVAAVPGMVAGMLHHLRSLRKLQHNNWIKTLLDEAENERMHLMSFMEIKKPNTLERLLILGVQGVWWNVFFLFYVFAPRTAHRFVGYLEEEACTTYTNMLEKIDKGEIENVPAPQIAKDYWNMPEDATLRDLVVVIRADEMDHRDVNHTMSDYISELGKVKFNVNIQPQDRHSVDEAIEKSGKKPLET